MECQCHRQMDPILKSSKQASSMSVPKAIIMNASVNTCLRLSAAVIYPERERPINPERALMIFSYTVDYVVSSSEFKEKPTTANQ
jgi:hypothetical protein